MFYSAGSDYHFLSETSDAREKHAKERMWKEKVYKVFTNMLIVKMIKKLVDAFESFSKRFKKFSKLRKALLLGLILSRLLVMLLMSIRFIRGPSIAKQTSIIIFLGSAFICVNTVLRFNYHRRVFIWELWVEQIIYFLIPMLTIIPSQNKNFCLSSASVTVDYNDCMNYKHKDEIIIMVFVYLTEVLTFFVFLLGSTVVFQNIVDEVDDDQSKTDRRKLEQKIKFPLIIFKIVRFARRVDLFLGLFSFSVLQLRTMRKPIENSFSFSKDEFLNLLIGSVLKGLSYVGLRYFQSAERKLGTIGMIFICHPIFILYSILRTPFDAFQYKDGLFDGLKITYFVFMFISSFVHSTAEYSFILQHGKGVREYYKRRQTERAIKRYMSSSAKKDLGKAKEVLKQAGIQKIINHVGCIDASEIEMLNEKLGKGKGGGVVLKGAYKGTLVAIKIFSAKSLLRKNVENELETELRIYKDIRNENLVTFYGCLKDPHFGIVNQFCRYGSLSTFLDNKEMTMSRKVKILAQIAAGLSYLHESNVIHRDLKTENILIDHNFQARITDFGLSIICKGSAKEKANHGKWFGTSYFMAPEVYKFDEYNCQCDVFSFGMIIYEVLTGKENPFPDEDQHKISGIIADHPEKIEPLLTLDVPVGYEWLLSLMRECLRFNPEERITSRKLKEVFDEELAKENATGSQELHLQQ